MIHTHSRATAEHWRICETGTMTTVLFPVPNEQCNAQLDSSLRSGRRIILVGSTPVLHPLRRLAHDRGTVEVGKRADIAEWDIGHPAELTYWIGLNQLDRLMIGGKIVDSSPASQAPTACY